MALSLQLAQQSKRAAYLDLSFSSPRSSGTTATNPRMLNQLSMLHWRICRWNMSTSIICTGLLRSSLEMKWCLKWTARCRPRTSIMSIRIRPWKGSSRLAKQRLLEFQTFQGPSWRDSWRRLLLFLPLFRWSSTHGSSRRLFASSLRARVSTLPNTLHLETKTRSMIVARRWASSLYTTPVLVPIRSADTIIGWPYPCWNWQEVWQD